MGVGGGWRNGMGGGLRLKKLVLMLGPRGPCQLPFLQYTTSGHSRNRTIAPFSPQLIIIIIISLQGIKHKRGLHDI